MTQKTRIAIFKYTMSKSIQFDTKNQSFRQLMGNGIRYKVPRFQRDYSWSEEQWEELWLDINGCDVNEQHYMGYLVLQSTDNKNFFVIDGQQRLTTISILILATLYRFKALDDEKRLSTIKNSFIGFTDPVTLNQKNKLVLNRNNDTYFNTCLCQLIEPAERNINQSNHLMRKALNFFKKKIDGQSETEMAKFVEHFADCLIFTTITVTKDSNAYSIFETLNARGVKLSVPDLVKNDLFSTIDQNNTLHDEEIKSLDSTWETIVTQLGQHKFSDFIRVDWNSRYELAPGKELFKRIKGKVNDNSKAREYLKSLLKNSEIYSALRNEGDEFWKNHKEGRYNSDPRLKQSLKTLILFNVVAPLNTLLAAFKRFSHTDFIKFLGFIETISVRYNFICKKPTNEQHRVYSEVALMISKNKDSTPQKTLSILQKIYPSDNEFLSSFEDSILKVAKSEKRARYLIYRIEKNLSSDTFGNFEDLTLEHILPRNFDAQWEKGFDDKEKIYSFIDRIGNMAILPRATNNALGNKSFSEKKPVFEKSGLKTTEKCAEYAQWNEESILTRQKWLGEKACSLWRVPGL